MAADYSRIHRLLKILTLIQSGGWTAGRLADECSTTQRTIYRDLKMLQAAGIPYFFDETTRSYSVRKDFFMPPVQLTLDETLALATLADHVGGQAQVPYLQAASRAIAKVRGQLPPAIRSELEKIESHISIHLAAASPPDGATDVYQRVRAALTCRKALFCEYDSLRATSDRRLAHGRGANGANREFLFKPYALFFSQRAWYAVGEHSRYSDLRCLKLNRFIRIEPCDHSYRIPRSFSLDHHLGNAWRMIRGKDSHEVELWFDPEFAETIADTHWHRTQEIEWNSDGSIRFRCRVDGLDEIVWWILSMGPHCVVRKPRKLLEQLKHLIEQMRTTYAAPPVR